jgi:hypothetical protein
MAMKPLAGLLFATTLLWGGETPLWEFTYLQSKPGEHERLVQFLKANWLAMDREAVRQGLFVSYQLLEPVARM